MAAIGNPMDHPYTAKLETSVIMRIAEEGVGNFEGTAVQAAHARDHRA
jgi:hypothetical protein